MIAVSGASGSTGGAVLQRLREEGVACRAVSRDPAGLRKRLGLADDIGTAAEIEFAAADAADADSLRAAFDGCDQLFLTMVNSPRQVEFETRAIDIAVERGVSHIVKLSAPAAEPDSPVAISRWHWTIEEHLRASGVTATVLRPYAFMQKLLTLAPGVREGVIVGTMGETACNWIDCRDIGDVAAATLTRPELRGRTHVLTGAEVFGYPDIAAALSGLLDRPIRYVDVPPEALRDNLIHRAHLPEWLAAHVAEIQLLARARPEHPTDTVARILGRPPRTLPDFLTEHLADFR
ncbi:NmrA family NAD(P)-binding protein [Nocardia seriolae]|uniref:NAD(P)H dehydrogenase (Quinone) n=1 Tax=Nocardia seriolae TaxID=37332 RepID=A0ABC8ANY5_9NOCA|nr:NmrA family NAD(P)-binding protein [Nocardia seriolae]APA95781.1 NAD(P)H dehydrogenase (quinone) [Nocardia seriolae]MTJ66103.1 NAD(P)H-binding protein [Nocardia seriolae]MTJ74105.1 NAD(P)H-binding protein [Nocardia seriolae]MTJ85980.1 NAD(P)H-binding protein [Nocardia seriolae]MTK29974.1 NAD(P)H-binding protein [Nocardia seriolae]